MEFETLENEVIYILKHNQPAKADDMVLYANYVYRKVENKGLGLGWFQRVFSDRYFRVLNGIAPYSTISRVRRKIQEKYPELRPSEAMIEERKEMEKKYRAYARGNK